MWGAIRNRDYGIRSIFLQNMDFEARSSGMAACVLLFFFTLFVRDFCSFFRSEGRIFSCKPVNKRV